ncbi:sulfotransferase domain-containing protein [Desulfovibrio mangrovi]|uniref:sulfotransferase domain-containing protein n=1 Tax=Desulfovibrio mangrovi TaxID=2976983 RepID=UPI0022478F9A|nr:sulfotransferase domain-containing protein [Desulfovibrio mangrovi]UZP66881.1 sulfotransferase domain-containing protein [Desulfovibrio mangrovi]
MIQDSAIEQYVQRSKQFEDQTIILDSIRKSGTNYLRIIVANYLSLIYSSNEGRVSYSELKDMFPNQRDFVMFPEKYSDFKVHREYVPACKDHVIRQSGYSDFIFGHDDYEYLKYSSASKIVHLYRNPLDMAVSYYYFAFKNRIGSENKKESKIDLAVNHLMKFYIEHYRFARDFSRKSDKVIRIAYESLFTNPFDVVLMLFQWLNFKIDTNKLRVAIENSSINKARQEEKDTGRAVVMPESSTFTGSFVRSGAIGQWREHFNTVEAQMLIRLLEKHDISVDEFVMG